MAENPVIRNFGKMTNSVGTPSASELDTMYDAPAYTGPRTAKRYMTLDDVVVRTGAMLAVLLAVGAVSWSVTDSSRATPILIVALMGSIGLGLYMAFKMVANAPLALGYAAFEGALLGSISRVFEDRFPGIVIQAVIGTVMVAAGMLFVYKIGAIRVTPKFTRIVWGATIGAFGLMLVNLVAYLFTPGGLGLRDSAHPAIAIGFSLLCIGIASMNLVVDFDMVEQGIRKGADEKFAWYCAFGITVTLVWLYLEILRLLSYLRD
jgi:uncharacterized YccA/Bax inhibitor family protein